MLSIGGTAGPGLVSVLNPYPPPQPPWLQLCGWLAPSESCIQYAGATYSYGPLIFTPLSPVTVVGFAVADEITGFGHSSSFSTFKYVCSTSGGGGLSLPFSHTSRLGCSRNR